MAETYTGMYLIVCPDGQTRHYPYRNENDAVFDATHDTEHGHPALNEGQMACDGGDHTINLIVKDVTPLLN